MKWTRRISLSAIVLLVLAKSLFAQYAAEMADGITVSGTGQSAVQPNKVQIDIRTSASAELTADAVVKFRDTLRRSKQAFEKLKIENLQVVDGGMSISTGGLGRQQVVYAAPVPVAGEGGPTFKQEVAIGKSLKLTVVGIDKLSEDELIDLVAKLLDGVKDVGLTAGTVNPNNPVDSPDGQSPTMVMFVADDLAAAQKRATNAAFENAKEKAQRIADLSGAKLGPVSAVEDCSTPETTNEYVTETVGGDGIIQRLYTGGAAASSNSAIKSFTLSELPVRANLRVRFALQPSGGSK